MGYRWFLKAQSTAEYAVLLAIVAGALIGMQIYIKRAVQGRVRDLADQISPTHYESALTDSTFTTRQTGRIIQSYDGDTATSTTRIPQNWTDGSTARQGETTTRWGNEQVTEIEVQE